MAERNVPTLHDWLGGTEKLEALFGRFYQHVREDSVLAPIFPGLSPEHPKHVAAFVAEVFGGPRTYSEDLGGHVAMIRKHLGKNLTEPQRRRWMNLLLDTADEVGLPADPEFRSALVAYLEWGSRLAVMNSQAGAKAVEGEPMPVWSWGAPGGPYLQK